MKIIFTGLPYFSSKLVKELKNYDKSNNYYFFNTYYSKRDQLLFLLHTINADLIISFNGVTSKSKALDWAILWNKKIVMQWHGTDVMQAIQSKNTKQFKSKYINHSHSYTDAIWLKNELKEISIEAQLLHFKHFDIQHINTIDFTTTDVLTYIAQDKEQFYGIEPIKKLACLFPQITFNIVGSNGDNDSQKTENIIYHGWVDQHKMQELKNSCPIFIRFTEHDGYSLSILEAIANGNYVIWNHPHPRVNYATNTDGMIKALNNCIEQIKANPKPLKKNIEWIAQNANKETILNQLIETFEYVAKK